MNLKEKTISAFLWVSSAKAISQGFSWLITILLIRFLTPADFGLVAMASIFIGFLDLLNDLGIQATIIQKEDLDDEDLHSIFWISIASGLLFYGISVALAPLVAEFFDNEKLVSILNILALNFILASLRAIPLSLVTKELAFGKRSIAESVSVVTGGVISVALAILGYSVWSLVYGTLVRNLTLTLFAVYFARWTPKFVFSVVKAKRMLNFGLSVAGSTILWYFYSNFDSLIIGKLLGNRALGYYSVALDLANIPTGRIMAIINQVSLPICSKLQGNVDQLRLYFLKITRFLSLIICPAMVGLLLVSKEFVEVVLTEAWLPVLFPFRVLCFVGLLKSLDQVIPTILFAKGKATIVLWYSCFCLLTFPIAFLIGSYFGVEGVVVALALVYPLGSMFLFKFGLSELGLRVSDYIHNLRSAISATVVMALVVMSFQLGNKMFYGGNSLFALLVSCCLGILAYFAYFVFFRKDVLDEVQDMYRSLRFADTSDSRGVFESAITCLPLAEKRLASMQRIVLSLRVVLDPLFLMGIRVLRFYTVYTPWGKEHDRIVSLIPAFARRLAVKHSILINSRDGRKFCVDPREFQYQMGLLEMGVFEPNETAAVSCLITPGSIAIDAGANFGWYTTLFSDLVGEEGRVHAFEPMPHIAMILKENCVLNGCDNVVINQLALGDRPGQSLIHYLPDRACGDASLFPPTNHERLSYPCAITTLNDYFAQLELSRCDFIKCDIEGAELLFMKGASRILEEYQPIVLFEVNPAVLQRALCTPSDLLREMRRHGDYVFLRLNSSNRWTTYSECHDSRGSEMRYFNVLALMKDSPSLKALGF